MKTQNSSEMSISHVFPAISISTSEGKSHREQKKAEDKKEFLQ